MHGKVFQSIVTVGKISSRGSGINKKTSERIAAFNLHLKVIFFFCSFEN